MHIEQFEDKNLSHYSYAVLSDCEKKIVLIDPARNPKQYYDYADKVHAEITGIIETHPHADFVSSHLELHEVTGAAIYTSKLVDAGYPHTIFDDGDTIEFGKIRLSAINTPGHSPDSISIVLEHEGQQKAVFTGDTLFIGDCGRPDLREGVGNIQSTRETLAKQMYHSLRDKLATLPGDVKVYPAHGAGTLCGKNLSTESSSTIREEKLTNWSLQDATENEFVSGLLEDQPFIPSYFPFDVAINRNGALPLKESITKIKRGETINEKSMPDLDESRWVIDTRKEEAFKKGHLANSINIIEEGKFETWLGTIVKPGERFYLVSESEEQLQNMLQRVAEIGYEGQVAEGFVIEYGPITDGKIDLTDFKKHQEDYTILDVRNKPEVKAGKIFKSSLSIPLGELLGRVKEIPTDKPVVVHCAGGYRSAVGASMIQSKLNGEVKVFDLGEAIKEFN